MKNDETTGMAMVFGLFIAVVYFVAAFVFALVAFVCCIMTVLAIIAWIRPFKLFGEEFTSEDGRGFIVRGILGTLGFLAFAEFSKALLGFTITEQLYNYIAFCGYAFGSLVIGYALEQERQQAELAVKAERGRQELIPPPVPTYAPPPFDYAGWNDEEELR